jgi:hypothetical protein
MRIILIPLLLLAGACDRDREEHRSQGYAGTLDSLGIPHRTLSANSHPVDLGDWPKDRAANGVNVRRVTGAALGLPRSTFPYARFTTSEAVKRIDFARQGTGLFVVDTDHVPADLPGLMKSKELSSKPDGSLVDAIGEPAALLIQSETYAVQVAGQVRTSWLGRMMDEFVTPAQAARPFPFRCLTFSTWALYHSGFHRWYEAGTDVAAFGANASGTCGLNTPRTRIDYLQARTAVQGPGTENFCLACLTTGAYDQWDVGYGWPAHGVPTTTHSGLWADGSRSFTRTATRSW